MRALQIGDPVFEGELLASGPSGHLHIRTADGGFLALRPASSARIETFAFDPQRPADTRIRLILERGVMRAVSGAGAQASRERFRLNTPLAAIGIRGTDFTVESSDQHTRVAVHSGAVVLSAFSATCRPELLGPCLGDASRTLSADNPGGILELRRGEAEPRFL
ncbi:MAG: FecR domain-containing protein, partial [Betaproteobacteria bacterium]|nr:FecR domain-containing protein [Betaproteobacteria bacterium]